MAINESVCPIQLTAPASYIPRVPHAVFAMLRRTQPVFWHQPDDKSPGFWAVLKYRDVMEISMNAKLYSSARGVFYFDIDAGESVQGSLLTSDPPKHTFLRAQLSEWFTSNAVNRLEPWLRRESKVIMKHAAVKDRCEFVYEMAAPLPLLTICEFMGVPQDDRAHILALSDKVLRSTSVVEFSAAMHSIADFGIALARSGSEGGNDAVASKLRSLTQDGSLPEVEFGNQFAQLIVAGNETTRTLLSNIILEFCEHPDIFQSLKDDPAGIPLAIEEFLRWTSPIYQFRRTTTADVELRGKHIKAGDPVVFYYVSANRDEEVFENPDVLNIRRKPNRHLSFGVGRHTCLGAQVARLETRIFLEEFLASFDALELAGLPERFPSNSVNGWRSIPLRLTAASAGV